MEPSSRRQVWLGRLPETQNPNSKNPNPNPKNPSPKNPNSNSGSNPRYPKLLRVIRVSDHSTRITQKNPILKKSYLKFYLVLAISAQSAQILVASHGPRRPKPYPESSFLTIKTQNKNIFRLSHLSSLDLSLDLSISLCSDEFVPRDGTSAPSAALPASHWPPAGRRCASTR